MATVNATTPLEPWQMAQSEFIDSGWSARRSGKHWNVFRPDGSRWGFTGSRERPVGSPRTALKLFHEQQVQFAVAQGWPVPAPVAAEYP